MLNYRTTTGLYVALLLCSLVMFGSEAGSQSRQAAEVPWDVLDESGGRMCSESYSVGGSLGQIAPGITVGTTRRVSAGYWAGIDTLPPCISEGGFIRGDVDTIAGVFMSDAIYLLKALYVPGADTLTCLDSGDVNDDGGEQPTMGDAIHLLRWLYVPGADPIPPPAPSASGDPNIYPEDCGIDPTPDEMGCIEHPCMGGKYTGGKEAKPIKRTESVR